MKPQLFNQMLPIPRGLASPHTNLRLIGICDVNTGEIIAWCRTLNRALLLIEALNHLGIIDDAVHNQREVARQAEALRQQGFRDTE